MTSATEAVRALMVQDAPLFALLGTRVFPIRAPQATVYPYCIYDLDGGEPFTHSLGQSRIGQEYVTLTAWSETYGQCRTILNMIRDLLNGFRGNVAIDGSTTYHLSAVWVQDYDIDAEGPTDGSDQVIYYAEINLQVTLSYDVVPQPPGP
jgi:hypothetical protein